MTEKRRKKLASAIRALRELPQFSAEEAKLFCRDWAPAYITKTIKDLHGDGLLKEDSTDQRTIWRWAETDYENLDRWIDRKVHGQQVKETPESDRPREQLLSLGPEKLTTDQLLAILIRVGIPGESAMQAGRLLANRFGDRLEVLPEASLPELREITRAIRKDSYSQIMAGIELGRRIAARKSEQPSEQWRIRGTDEAIQYCLKTFRRLALDAKQEQFHIVTLDTQHGPIDHHLITVGTLDASLVHPREVFRPAIRDAAAAILLVHNHPSGDPTPSKEDRMVTKKLKEAGDLIGIRVLDHIIVAKDSARSLTAEA
jgi:DNA repair protein RadC